MTTQPMTDHDRRCRCNCDWCNLTDTPCRRCDAPTAPPAQVCPCCGAAQPAHSAIAYCDDCNTDTCGHHAEAGR